jgi:hypothetical protein
VISEAERDQRLRDINRRLREIMARRAAISEQWGGAAPLDISAELSQLDEETNELRAERADLQEPGAIEIWNRINAMWKIVNDLHLDMRERWRREEREREARQRQIDIWLGGVTAGLAVLTLAVWWLASQVWRITELWR